MCGVRLVTVAWMRCWYWPWPNWTRLWSLSRIQGIRRSSAARTSDIVLGPERAALREADELVALGGEVEVRRAPRRRAGARGGSSECSSASAEPPGLDADVLLLVLVDHVVVAGRAGAAGLAEGHRLAGHVLQLDRDVLEDVAEPGALVLAAGGG